MTNPQVVFSPEWLVANFPQKRTDDFFEALFGEAEEGAYDIALAFVKSKGCQYEFAFELHQRPGKCLVCNLTYGLPQVFARHPIINVKGLVANIAEALGKDTLKAKWELQNTQEINKRQHNIPLIVKFEE